VDSEALVTWLFCMLQTQSISDRRGLVFCLLGVPDQVAQEEDFLVNFCTDASDTLLTLVADEALAVKAVARIVQAANPSWMQNSPFHVHILRK